MRALSQRRNRDAVHELLVGSFVLAERRVLAGAVAELAFRDHADAVLYRANRFADAATAARVEVRFVGAVSGDVERPIGAVQPAQRALGASFEVHHRTEGAGSGLLQLCAARRTESSRLAGDGIGIRTALWLAWDGDARTHVFP